MEDALTDAGPEAFVVDIGAGRGELIGMLSKKGYRVLGVDPEEECVLAASSRAECVRGDIDDLNGLLGARKPDVVVCSHVLEHLDAPLDALRKLTETGADWLILAVPNLHRSSRLLRAIAGRRRADHPAHLYGWGHAEFQALIERAGLSVRQWYVDRVTVNPLSGRLGFQVTRRLRVLEERIIASAAPTLSSSLITRCEPKR